MYYKSGLIVDWKNVKMVSSFFPFPFWKTELISNEEKNSV